MSAPDLRTIVARNRAGERIGLPSFCTASPDALRAALDFAAAHGLPVLVEATCNQVNQYGGYTGMVAAEYRRFVESLAEACGCSRERMLLGGDHLGPNPWRDRPAGEAMAEARELIRSYAAAGFTKLHLDASMACGGEPPPSPAIVAERTAALCRIAEDAAPDPAALHYVVGTEVPTPGGEREGHELAVTTVASLDETIATHRKAFAAHGLDSAWERVVGVVAQPGVDFSVADVHAFEPAAARDLSSRILEHPDVAFEAHSTDYQSEAALAELVNSRFAILKVGPELTFAFREAIVALCEIERLLVPADRRAAVVETVLAAMAGEPDDWRAHYEGDPARVRMLQLYGFSDRIRYYWGRPEVAAALARLFDNLAGVAIPRPLVSQFLPGALTDVPPGIPIPGPRGLVAARVGAVVRKYYAAAGHPV